MNFLSKPTEAFLGFLAYYIICSSAGSKFQPERFDGGSTVSVQQNNEGLLTCTKTRTGFQAEEVNVTPISYLVLSSILPSGY